MGLRRDLERADERPVGAQRHLDVGPAAELQHGARVALHVVEVDVAGHAGDGHELRLGRGAGVEQRQAVVDAGVDVEDDRDRAREPLIGDARHEPGSTTTLAGHELQVDGQVAAGPRASSAARRVGRVGLGQWARGSDDDLVADGR